MLSDELIVAVSMYTSWVLGKRLYRCIILGSQVGLASTADVGFVVSSTGVGREDVKVLSNADTGDSGRVAKKVPVGDARLAFRQFCCFVNCFVCVARLECRCGYFS